MKNNINKKNIEFNMNKLIIFILMLILGISSVNSVTQLTQCGKNSAWVNGETYILNFTEVPSTYPNAYCFQIHQIVDNLTFQGYNQEIFVNKSMASFFDVSATNVFTKTNYSFIDFKIRNNQDYQNTNSLFTVTKAQTTSSGNSFFVNSTINNVELYNYKHLFDTNLGVGGGTLTLSHWDINNLFFEGVDNIFNQGGALGSSSSSYNQFNVTNSVLLSEDGFLDISQRTTGEAQFYFNNFTNSVIRAKHIGRPHSASGLVNRFTNSLLYNELPADGNYNEYNGLVTNIFVLGKRYVEDTSVSLTSFNNEYIISIANENLNILNGFELIGSTGNFLDVSYLDKPSTSNFTSATGISLGETQLLCSFSDCLFEDISTTILGSASAGQIEFRSNSAIYNQTYTRLASATTDVRYISGGSSTRNNITIAGNDVTMNFNTGFGSDYTSTGSREIFKASVNNLNMFENIFKASGTNEENHTMLQVTATNPTSNFIYSNNFSDLRVSPTGTAYVFNLNGDSNFYNNYIGNNVLLSRINLEGLNASPRIYYQHSNGNIYLYKVGNFYADNVGCSDGNSDGLCDSPYVSGSNTDYFPLSSYPFDFEGNILFAEETITNSSIDVQLLTPTNGQSFNLASASSTINISFQQVSSFNDLICDYIVDGASVNTVSNVASSVQQSILVNGWTTGNHTIRVECFNEVSFDSSTEITIETIIGTTTGGGNGDDGLTGDNPIAISGEQLFNADDIAGTTDNVITFFGDLGAFFFNIIVPIVIFISIIGAIVFIVILLS